MTGVLRFVLLLSLAVAARAGNPLIGTVYSADPSGHVWPGDDRLWIYASHDQPGTNSHDTMISYHVFSSSDLINWTDYGVVLHLKDVSWAASNMWAIDCVLWKGTYYLVFCAQEKDTGIFRTGLATSARPEGPFTDIGYIRGVEWGQDPALFVDDDGKPYLYWGAGGNCHGAQLTDDLRSVVPGTVVDLTSQLTNVYEGPWVHKYLGKYYLSYPGLVNKQWPEHMFYAIADRPLGPYAFKGEYIPVFPGQAGTNHGSIIEYKGQWYALHHSMWVSGGLSEVRNLMMDYLHYNADGTIQPITPTHEGVAVPGKSAAPSHVTVQLEAENGLASCGSLLNTRVGHERAGYSGSGYVTGLLHKNDGVTVMVQSAKARAARLKIRYVAPAGDRENKVFVNYTILRSQAYPKPEKFTIFPKTTDWGDVDLGIVHLKEGDNYLRISAVEGGIDVDRFMLEQEDSPE